MSQQIEKAYVNSFRAGFEQAFQQTMSRLRPYVEVERQSGEFDYYDRIGLADDMTEVTTRYGDNPVNEINHDRRRIQTRVYELGKPVDEKDLMKVLTDPSHAYTQAMVASANRKIDDIIAAGFTATAFTGKSGGTSVAFASSTADKYTVGKISDVSQRFANGTYTVSEASTEGIDVNVSYTGTTGATGGLTLAKLRIVREVMMKLDAITQDTVLNCFVSARQIQDLLSIDQVINSDYAVRKALAEGSVTTYMGFRFIHCERLPKSDSTRYCFVTLPKAYKLAIDKDINVDAWRLSAQKNIPYIYLSMAMGGSRMWGEVLARIGCNEA